MRKGINMLGIVCTCTKSKASKVGAGKVEAFQSCNRITQKRPGDFTIAGSRRKQFLSDIIPPSINATLEFDDYILPRERLCSNIYKTLHQNIVLEMCFFLLWGNTLAF